MLFDLGVEPDQMKTDWRMTNVISQLDWQFDQVASSSRWTIARMQVLILEKLSEGLVLLAHSLCWSLDQVQGKLREVYSSPGGGGQAECQETPVPEQGGGRG